MEFFHLSTQNAVDYAEFVASGSPEKRVMRDLGAMRTVDQDRMVGRMLFEYMGELFSFFMVEMGNFVEWAVKTDPM